MAAATGSSDGQQRLMLGPVSHAQHVSAAAHFGDGQNPEYVVFPCPSQVVPQLPRSTFSQGSSMQQCKCSGHTSACHGSFGLRCTHVTARFAFTCSGVRHSPTPGSVRERHIPPMRAQGVSSAEFTNIVEPNSAPTNARTDTRMEVRRSGMFVLKYVLIYHTKKVSTTSKIFFNLTPVKDSHGTFKDTMTVELDVEYALGAFYSLQSGLLPATDEQSGAPLIQSGDAVQWKELPTSTRVGWRGPMILWNHVLHDIEPLFCGP